MWSSSNQLTADDLRMVLSFVDPALAICVSDARYEALGDGAGHHSIKIAELNAKPS